MRLLTELPGRPRGGKPLALAIGVFDGVHRGHQAVLKEAVRAARAKGWIAGALAFDPAPEFALGLRAPERLQHPQEQAESMAALGLDVFLRVPFTTALARLSARDFAETVLARNLRCAAVVVGKGFRFGAGAKGDAASLKTFGNALGFTVAVQPPKLDHGSPVSSTRIRAAVASGRLEEAARLLGRDWRLRGEVVTGKRLGRTLGFPTANVESPQGVLPPRGVWAGRLKVLGRRSIQERGFVGNLGVRPTLGEGLRPTVELHLLDFSGELVGKILDVRFIRRLRGETKFASLDALKQGIAADVLAARKALKTAKSA
jgi:riboflavin kinase/FMN adenylyltransferase